MFSKHTASKPTCISQSVFCSRSIPMPVINPAILSPYPKQRGILLSVFLGVTADHCANHITWNVLQPQLIFPIKYILSVVVVTTDCSVKKTRIARENKKKLLHMLFCSLLKEVFVFNFCTSVVFSLSVESDTKSFEA